MTLDDLAKQAASEGWHIQPPHLERKPIVDPETDEVVGFYCPHPAGRGLWRVGPIYVHPDFRGRGLALQAYAWATDDQPLVAYIHNTNVQSARLHERSGFRRWYKTKSGWYVKRP